MIESELAKVTLILGGALTVIYILLVTVPGSMLTWARKFPRDEWAGRILAAIDVAWVAWLLSNMALGRFESYRNILYFLVPVTFFLVVIFMAELLAARALGGLMLLVPVPILNAARNSDSVSRFIIVVIAYIIVIKGIVLVLSPYQFRKALERFVKSKASLRAWGLVGLAISLLLVILALTVY